MSAEPVEPCTAAAFAVFVFLVAGDGDVCPLVPDVYEACVYAIIEEGADGGNRLSPCLPDVQYPVAGEGVAVDVLYTPDDVERDMRGVCSFTCDLFHTIEICLQHGYGRLQWLDKRRTFGCRYEGKAMNRGAYYIHKFQI